MSECGVICVSKSYRRVFGVCLYQSVCFFCAIDLFLFWNVQHFHHFGFPISISHRLTNSSFSRFLGCYSTTLMWAGPSQHYSVCLHVAIYTVLRNNQNTLVARPGKTRSLACSPSAASDSLLSGYLVPGSFSQWETLKTKSSGIAVSGKALESIRRWLTVENKVMIMLLCCLKKG